MNTGPCWLFASDNNLICTQQGMCPAMNKVAISDQDSFIFTYVTSF